MHNFIKSNQLLFVKNNSYKISINIDKSREALLLLFSSFYSYES